jgi:hypothetical protein
MVKRATDEDLDALHTALMLGANVRLPRGTRVIVKELSYRAHMVVSVVVHRRYRVDSWGTEEADPTMRLEDMFYGTRLVPGGSSRFMHVRNIIDVESVPPGTDVGELLRGVRSDEA